MKFLVVAAALSALASAASLAPTPTRVSYDGYKVYRVSVGSEIESIKSIIKKLNLQSWSGAPKARGLIDLVVPPTELKTFERDTESMTTELMHADLGLSIAEESNSTGSFSTLAAPDVTYFNTYHSIADHTTFLQSLQSSFPANSEIISAGKSNSGRDIPGIHIYGSGGKGSKKAIVWHGTVHAREWITTMTVEYAAWTLLTKYASDPTIKGFVDKYDYYIFPFVNPDGFAYTQTNDRLWRKNRQTNPGSTCLGRDVNRNWPYVWAQSGGASTNPCAQDYKGPSAGDGTETKALKAQLDSLTTAAGGKGIQMYIDFHSYSQLFMTPYGYSCSAVLPNSAKYQSLAAGTANAIKSVNGLIFEYGPICQTIYQTSGDGVDYAADVAKAAYSFTVELRDTGRYGFVLPANQIVPAASEMWAGLKYLLANI
ncbi:hypothetical protein K402DRAFT_111691 [Aulographum hederae CBS 113979]|uniref:Peptidase M14 domain-containing protein n=1 Tax=Aulographum hederae CBS 113979 TaxID=1176131 RepID=A0A6G1GWS2_9PEZI|nr:hypothetical protein K402DRAFT_111691 [Aulographum hederae CBS 113979]